MAYLALMGRATELPEHINHKLVNTDEIQREQGNNFRPAPVFAPQIHRISYSEREQLYHIDWKRSANP